MFFFFQHLCVPTCADQFFFRATNMGDHSMEQVKSGSFEFRSPDWEPISQGGWPDQKRVLAPVFWRTRRKMSRFKAVNKKRTRKNSCSSIFAGKPCFSNNFMLMKHKERQKHTVLCIVSKVCPEWVNNTIHYPSPDKWLAWISIRSEGKHPKSRVAVLWLHSLPWHAIRLWQVQGWIPCQTNCFLWIIVSE